MFNRLEGELDAREHSLGLRIVDFLTLPDHLTNLLNWLIRQKQVSLADVVQFLGQDESAAQSILTEVIQKGYVREFDIRGTTFYRVRIATGRVRNRISNIWDALDDKVEDEESGQ